MKRFISLSLLSSVTALSHDDVVPPAQAQQVQDVGLQDACPSDSVLVNGHCQLSQDLQQISYENQTTKEPSHNHAQDAESLPWTYWPECYANENTTEPICVFTHQAFASGRGIFLSMSSAKAYDLLDKPGFTNPEAHARVNQYHNPPFAEHHFPGKGRGLVANKTLHRGDQIFASTPLLISHPDQYALVPSERLALLHRGVETLPEDSHASFWGLLGHFGNDPVDDRINTNAFEVEITGDTMYAVFPEMARINHDCRPNAGYFFDEESLSQSVHAIQTIYPGEEITITYINNERSREARVDNLHSNWGFECSCSSCAAHPELVAESDARLKQIERLSEILDNWALDSHATPEMAELLLSLYEQERMFANMGEAYKRAAETYSSFGDRYKAAKYARLSVELNALDKGFAHPEVVKMRLLAERPETSWSWGKRMGMARKSGCGCGHVH